MDNKKKIEAEKVPGELLSSSLFTKELKHKSKVESQRHIEDQSHLEANGRTRDKKSSVTSQLGEQELVLGMEGMPFRLQYHHYWIAK